MTRSSACFGASMTFAAIAASALGSTSSPCSRRRSSCASAPGKHESCRSNRKRGACSRTSTLEPDAQVEQRELLSALQTAIVRHLTPHQRRVLVDLALNGVPIDVLAERLETTRGALYKTLHDARHKLRAHLGERGLTVA